MLRTYDLGLRALTIGWSASMYARPGDHRRLVNDLLLNQFRHLTLYAWQELLFATLSAYEGQRELLFMPELYDFYWDTTVVPHRRRTEVRIPFQRLTPDCGRPGQGRTASSKSGGVGAAGGGGSPAPDPPVTPLPGPI